MYNIISRNLKNTQENINEKNIQEYFDSYDSVVSSYRGRGLTGVFHSFSGSAETAAELIKLGFYISFSGVITFKNAVKPSQVLKAVPDDRVLAETDCPYLAPVPYRGKINDSRLMRYTVEKMAQIKEMSYDEMAKVTERNEFELFGSRISSNA